MCVLIAIFGRLLSCSTNIMDLAEHDSPDFCKGNTELPHDIFDTLIFIIPSPKLSWSWSLEFCSTDGF